MAIYYVQLLKNIEASAWIEVEAEEEQQAKDKAIEESDSFNVDWDEDFCDVLAYSVELKEGENADSL